MEEIKYLGFETVLKKTFYEFRIKIKDDIFKIS